MTEIIENSVYNRLVVVSAFLDIENEIEYEVHQGWADGVIAGLALAHAMPEKAMQLYLKHSTEVGGIEFHGDGSAEDSSEDKFAETIFRILEQAKESHAGLEKFFNT